MAVPFLGHGAPSGTYSITNSIRLNGTSDYLTRTPGAASGNSQFWISTWLKLGKVNVQQEICSAYGGGTGLFIRLLSTGELQIQNYAGTVYRKSNRLFRDPSGWGHLFLSFDGSTSIDGWWSNEALTWATSGTLPASYDWHNNVVHRIACPAHSVSDLWTGGLSEFISVPGSTGAPPLTGKTDSNGVWVPIKYTGTYGTNGFKLVFDTSSDLGKDTGNTADSIVTPTMTGYTAPAGTVATNSDSASYEAWKAFDRDQGATFYWSSGLSPTYPVYVSYDLGGPARTVTSYVVVQAGDLANRAPKDWTLEGWNGSSWVVVDTRSNITSWPSTGTRYTYTVASPGSYTKYKFNCSANNGGTRLSIGEIELIGAGAHWAAAGSPVQTVDTPANNYCTFSSIDKGTSSATISNGGISATLGAGSHQSARGTVWVSSGKWYFEATYTTAASTSMTGVAQNSQSVDTYGGATSGGWALAQSGDKYNNAAAVSYLGATYTTGDVIGCALDMDNGKIWWRKNGGAWANSGDPVAGTNAAFTGITGPVAPVVSSNGGAVWTINAGQTAFAYTAPTGFKALCTANLPAVAIPKPSNYFQVALAAGASIKSTCEGLFSGDYLEWIKDRANSNNHQLIDTVRGLSAVLQSNSTGAETTYSAPSGSSVGWVWKRGATPGVDVITWGHTGGVTDTVTHSLGATPSMTIQKQRNYASTHWPVWHKSLTTGYLLQLDNAAAQASDAAINTVTSASFKCDSTVGTATMVAYCFAEIPGFSKFGSYTGNSNADGPFIYCGFRPRYILTKCSTGAGEWNVYDTARDTYNICGDRLLPDSTTAPNTLVAYDILSNGFKCRTNTGQDTNWSQTYIFAAFAEFPFGGSNVAPCPAR